MKIYLSFFERDAPYFQFIVTTFLERVVKSIEHAKLKRYFSEFNHPNELPTNGCSWESWFKEREPFLPNFDALTDSPEEIGNYVLMSFFTVIKEKRVEVDPEESSEDDWSLHLQVPMKDQCITLHFVKGD